MASFSDRAYYAIRELIVTLELPPGAVVREPELTARLGIGRTPVREALRRLAQERRDEGAPVRSPRDVWQLYAPRLEDLPVEEFHVCALDAQHRVTRDVLVTRGILNSSLVHPREVFREVIAECAAAVILVHNHPSGDPTPSADDRAVTDQLVAAGRLLDIPVLVSG